MAFEQEAVLLHQPVDALGVDRGQAVGSPLALEERGDPTVAVSRALIDQTSDAGAQFQVARRSCVPRFGLAPSRRSIRLDRATSSVSAIAFTGCPRAAASATATSVFLPAPGRAPP